MVQKEWGTWVRTVGSKEGLFHVLMPLQLNSQVRVPPSGLTRYPVQSSPSAGIHHQALYQLHFQHHHCRQNRSLPELMEERSLCLHSLPQLTRVQSGCIRCTSLVWFSLLICRRYEIHAYQFVTLLLSLCIWHQWCKLCLQQLLPWFRLLPSGVYSLSTA